MIRFFCQNSVPHFLTAEHMQFQQLMPNLEHPEIPNQLDLKPLRLLQHQTQDKLPQKPTLDYIYTPYYTEKSNS
ncbi:hypothetical protein D3844_07710 [Streptococcus mutans]|nr:hypothetical protein RO10_05030 [Streptococcus mutans]RKV85650.1 MAG: hypothetical protein D8H99_40095 [Streptococcus sp.]NLQ32066.1 hypothetical protein [Streptococcus mutans]NLQ38149.1 hypothetical protein [Streptococcus mutans]NLQ59228.1 hypothetical protein [Streptococcus mutans]